MQNLENCDLQLNENRPLVNEKSKKRFKRVHNRKRIGYYYYEFKQYNNMRKDYEESKRLLGNFKILNLHLQDENEELLMKIEKLNEDFIESDRENSMLRRKIEKLDSTVENLSIIKDKFESDSFLNSNLQDHLYKKIAQLSDENENLKRQVEICTTALTNN